MIISDNVDSKFMQISLIKLEFVAPNVQQAQQPSFKDDKLSKASFTLIIGLGQAT